MTWMLGQSVQLKNKVEKLSEVQALGEQRTRNRMIMQYLLWLDHMYVSQYLLRKTMLLSVNTIW